MANNFKIKIQRSVDNLNICLMGDFDGSSAFELLNSLTENLKNEIFERNVGQGPRVTPPVPPAIGLDVTAMLLERRLIGVDDARRHFDTFRYTFLRVRQKDLVGKLRIDFFRTHDVDRKNIVPKVAKETEAVFESI